MAKPAPADFPLHDLISRRWSPRAFADRPVPPEVLRSLLEAARWAPSCFNDQPWSYLVATKSDAQAFETMLSCLVEKNQQWAMLAPVLMLSVAARNFAASGKPNRHAAHDVGAASAQLAIEATARGLYVHQMGGIDPEKARKIYSVPESHEVLAGVALGYIGEAAQLPEQFRAAETGPRSSRKPQKDFVFAGKWGSAME